jgi:hypothetical protein
MPCGLRASTQPGSGCSSPTPTCSLEPDSLRRAIAYAEQERADHVVLFPQMIMNGVGERMMLAFFQVLFVFGHRPWKVADPKARDHMGVGAFNMVRRPVYDAVGTYRALRMDVIDDMKLGKIIKNAGFVQRNVFGKDLISLRWAKSAFGVVNNLTKNFFALLYFQWWRTLITIVGIAFINLGPFLGVWLAHGWARIPYAVALGSLFAIYCGMSIRSAIPPYYFFLHPVGTSLFVYILFCVRCSMLFRTTALFGGVQSIRWKSCARGWCESSGRRVPRQLDYQINLGKFSRYASCERPEAIGRENRVRGRCLRKSRDSPSWYWLECWWWSSCFPRCT